MAYTLYSASKSSTSLIHLKLEPICSLSRSASQSKFFYLQFGSGSNEKHRETYPRRIPRYVELEPTPIHLWDCRSPQPFWLIGVLDHQYILGCIRLTIKQSERYNVEAYIGWCRFGGKRSEHPCRPQPPRLPYPNPQDHSPSDRETSNRVIQPSWGKEVETNLIKEPFAIVCPSDGRKFHKTKLVGEAYIILSINQWMLSGAYVNVCEIASLRKRYCLALWLNKTTYRTGQSIGKPLPITRVGHSTQRNRAVAW